jgi:hypothetical protein
MATGLGYGARFSVLENSHHRWVKGKQSYKNKLQKHTIFCMLCKSSK